MQDLRDYIAENLNLAEASIEMRETIADFVEEREFVRFENGVFEGHYKGFFESYIRKSDTFSSEGFLGSGDPQDYMYTRLSEDAKEDLRNFLTDNNSLYQESPYQVFDFMINHMTVEQLVFHGI
jgi:hypothetical protein